MFKSKLKGWSREVAPEIRLNFSELNINIRFSGVFPSGLNQFESRSRSVAYDVDLEKRTCSYMIWQLKGYGCVHSIGN